MALAGRVGIAIEAHATLAPLGWFFGEDQGRYLVSTRDADAVIAMAGAGSVPARRIGVTGGGTISLGEDECDLTVLRDAHEGGFARMMGDTATR